MINQFVRLRTLLTVLLYLFSVVILLSQSTSDSIPSAPLFNDPVFDAPADPTVFWNYEEENWWMVYTQRRANV